MPMPGPEPGPRSVARRIGRRRVALGGLALALAPLGLVGCTSEGTEIPETPPTIVPGVTRCEGCAGPITAENLKFSGAIVDAPPAGTTYFGDIGTMIRHVQKVGRLTGYGWVHDYATGAWIDAQKAVYVVDSGVTTPAGSGVVAFADKAAAAARAEKGGFVQTWAQLLNSRKPLGALP